MLSCPSIQDILMNHFQYPGQTRAKTMCHKCGWPYLGIQPTWCVRPSPPSHLQVRGIEYLSTVAVGRRKSTKPAPFILVPLYLDSLHPVNCEVLSNKFFTPSKNRMSEYFDGDQYMKRLADREKAIPRDSPLLIQVSVGVCLFLTTKKESTLKKIQPMRPEPLAECSKPSQGRKQPQFTLINSTTF